MGGVHPKPEELKEIIPEWIFFAGIRYPVPQKPCFRKIKDCPDPKGCKNWVLCLACSP